MHALRVIDDGTRLVVSEHKVLSRLDNSEKRLRLEMGALKELDHTAAPLFGELLVTKTLTFSPQVELVYDTQAALSLREWLDTNSKLPPQADARREMAQKVGLAAVDLLRYLHEVQLVYSNFRAEFVLLGPEVVFADPQLLKCLRPRAFTWRNSCAPTTRPPSTNR